VVARGVAVVVARGVAAVARGVAAVVARGVASTPRRIEPNGFSGRVVSACTSRALER
jgi:hypothetical protein